ncbi:protein MIZU-KUSSEI 1-like [Salvia divinorum]|uniref:Protein MIZU-KUSSEI 1-like n=1 Tax=Salvia divinorum TaxID=28513 RepID=A0ABD1ILU1_SALDI
MIMSYSAAGGVTSVNCEKQVRSWRLLRSMAELLLPTCNCMITQENEPPWHPPPTKHFRHKRSSSASAPTTVSGTLYGQRRGKVTFCIQTNPSSTSPILLLELAIPTNVLAKEMKGGSIRFAFECKTDPGPGAGPLLSMPAWTMYCNGRKLGFAVKRKPSKADVELLEKMQNVVVGAGVASLADDVMYLRGKFERFNASLNSDSFHLVDPDAACNGQELSFYFLRSC